MGACVDKTIPETKGLPPLGNLEQIRVLPIITQSEPGLTADFVAMGVYTSGQSQPVNGGVTWTSSDETVAKVSSKGTVTAIGQGIATITAVVQGQTAKGQIAVGPKTLSVQLAPVKQTGQVDMTSAYQLMALYSDHTKKDVTASSTWAAHYGDIAAVADAGQFVGVAGGSTDVVGIYRDFLSTAPATLTIKDITLSSLAVSGDADMAKGTQSFFGATATFSDSSTVDVSDVTWATTDKAVAEVDADGIVTAKGPGTATISAEYKYRDVTKSGVLAVTVKPAEMVLTGIEVTPATRVVPLGVTSTFAAKGTFSDGTNTFQQDVTQVATWSVTLPKDADGADVTIGTGSLSSLGYRVSALKTFASAATVTAAMKVGDNTIKGTATVQVADTDANVAVAYTVGSAATSIAVGASTKMSNSALYTFADTTLGTFPRNVASLTVWEASPAGIVAVDNGTGTTQGTITGLKAGTATITGYIGGKSVGTRDITVTP